MSATDADPFELIAAMFRTTKRLCRTAGARRRGGRVPAARGTRLRPGPLVRSIVACACVAASAGSALAQQSIQAPPPSFAQIHMGPLYLTPTFGVTNLGLDTNVYNTQDERRADFTVTVGPRVQAVIAARRLQIAVTPRFDYVYYYTYSAERGWNPVVDVDAECQLTRRLQLFTNGMIGSMKARPSVEVDVRARHTAMDVDVGARLLLTRRIATQVLLRRHTVKYAPTETFAGVQLRTTGDQTIESAGLQMSYALTPWTTFIAGGEARRDVFQFADVRNGDVNTLWAGAQLKKRAIVAGDVRVGQTVYKTRAPGMADPQALFLDGHLTYTVSDATQFVVSARRDMAHSYTTDRPLYVRGDYEVSVRQLIGRRLDVGAAYQYYGFDYDGMPTIGPANPSTSISYVRGATVSFGVLNRKGSRYAVYVGRWERHAPFAPSHNYQGWRFGVLAASKSLTVNDRGLLVNGPVL